MGFQASLADSSLFILKHNKLIVFLLVYVDDIVNDLGIFLPSPPKLWCDNVFALAIVANLVFHARTKHVKVDYHFVRERVLQRDLQVKYIATGDQLADVFTKSLSTSRFLFLQSKIMVSLDPMVLRGDVKASGECQTQKQKLKIEEEEE